MARFTFSLGVHLLYIIESSTLHLGNLEEVLRSLAEINVRYYYFVARWIVRTQAVSFLKRNQPQPVFFISKRR